jgi:hypothetical protein
MEHTQHSNEPAMSEAPSHRSSGVLKRAGSSKVAGNSSQSQVTPPPGVLITELNHNHGDGSSPAGGSTISNLPERHLKKHHKKATQQALRVEDEAFEWRGHDQPCPLPTNIPIDLLVDEVGRSMTFGSSVQHREWTKGFKSPAVVGLREDMFWWIVCDKYGCGTEVDKARLFDRIAATYAKLVFQPKSHSKEAFLSRLWDPIAQFTFHAITLAYPKSSTLFDDRLKDTLINTFSEWVTGIRPMNASCAHWRLTPGKRPKNQGKSKLALLQVGSQQGAPTSASGSANAKQRTMINMRGENKSKNASMKRRHVRSGVAKNADTRTHTVKIAELGMQQAQRKELTSTPLFHLKPESVFVTERLGHSVLVEHFLRSRNVVPKTRNAGTCECRDVYN